MKIKIIKAVYSNSEEISPVGKALEEPNGDYKKCPTCEQGVLFIEFASGKTKCTQCDYEG